MTVRFTALPFQAGQQVVLTGAPLGEEMVHGGLGPVGDALRQGELIVHHYLWHVHGGAAWPRRGQEGDLEVAVQKIGYLCNTAGIFPCLCLIMLRIKVGIYLSPANQLFLVLMEIISTSTCIY